MSDSDEKAPAFKVVDRRTAGREDADDQAETRVKQASSDEAAAPKQTEPVATGAQPGEASGRSEARQPEEIDFGTFVMSLASSVLIHLGELMYPGESNEAAAKRINLPVAKQTVDIIGMLKQKTRGNLTDDEAKLIEHLLYDLRLKYVDARNRKTHG